MRTFYMYRMDKLSDDELRAFYFQYKLNGTDDWADLIMHEIERRFNNRPIFTNREVDMLVSLRAEIKGDEKLIAQHTYYIQRNKTLIRCIKEGIHIPKDLLVKKYEEPFYVDGKQDNDPEVT